MMGDEAGMAGEGYLPLPDNVPALRLDVRERRITEASAAMASLLACAPDDLVSRRFVELVGPAERSAVGRRLDDVLLLGRDAFGALALSGARADALVEVTAHYVYRGGQRLELAFRRLRRPRTPTPPEEALATTVDEAPPSIKEAAGANGAAPDGVSGTGLDAANAQVVALGLEGATTALAMGVLDSVGVAALGVSPDGMVASATVGAEKRLGMPIGRLLGRGLVDFFDLPPPAAEALRQAREGRLRQTVLSSLAGRPEQVVIDWVPGPEPAGGIALLGGGEATEAPSVQTESDRMQARLLSFVAHDVRECVASVTMGIQAVANELPEASPHAASVQRALREGKRANRMIDDLLLVTRPGRRSGVTLNLDSVLAETADRLHRRAEECGVELVLDLAAAVAVNVDLSSIERAFCNLVENALQATPRGGRVLISSVEEDRITPGARVSVVDSGAGIDAAIQPNIFEPFVTGKASGNGLGLAITRRVVLDHGGQIDFETEEGTGTTFHVWLPSSS